MDKSNEIFFGGDQLFAFHQLTNYMSWRRN